MQLFPGPSAPCIHCAVVGEKLGRAQPSRGYGGFYTNGDRVPPSTSLIILLAFLPLVTANPTHEEVKMPEWSTVFLTAVLVTSIFLSSLVYLTEIRLLTHPPIAFPLRLWAWRLQIPTIIWITLSIVSVCIPMLLGPTLVDLQGSVGLDADISGKEAQLCLGVSGGVAAALIILGRSHSEVPGAKEVSSILIITQLLYALRLFHNQSTKGISALDTLVAVMALDASSAIFSATLSMKECLATRLLVRGGLFLHFIILIGIAFAVATLPKFNVDTQRQCFRVYWWGPVSTCDGVSSTFWLYYALRFITTFHQFWICLRHTDNFGQAERSTRGVTGAIRKTVYNTIPATAFTKYKEWVPIYLYTMANTGLVRGSNSFQRFGVGVWGQMISAFISSFVLVSWGYAFYLMAMANSVNRKRVAPSFSYATHETWTQYFSVVLERQRISKTRLRPVDHARLDITGAWGEVIHHSWRWPNKTPEELGALLVAAAIIGDLEETKDLLMEKADLIRVDKWNVALTKGLEHGHVKVADLLLEKMLARRSEALDSPETLDNMRRLGGLYVGYMDFATAENWLQRALVGQEVLLGPESLDTLSTIDNLADIYGIHGRFHEAAEFYQRALTGREKQLGPNHPHTLCTVGNLARIYTNLGRYHEAEKLSQRALVGKERILGPDHLDTLQIVDNLANLYNNQGRYHEAGELCQRTLVTKERVLGPDHPATLWAVSNLASVYNSLRRYTEAEELYKRALGAAERVLGPDNPKTLEILDNFAGMYTSQRRYSEAGEFYQRAVDGKEKELGPYHPCTLLSIMNLMGVYTNLGRYHEADGLCQKVLAGSKVLGCDNPPTIDVVNGLAGAYTKQGRYPVAEGLYEKVLIAREKILGLNHPDTLSAVNNLAGVYTKQRRFSEARELYQRALSEREKILGSDHPDTLFTATCLASLPKGQGRVFHAALIKGLNFSESIITQVIPEEDE